MMLLPNTSSVIQGYDKPLILFFIHPFHGVTYLLDITQIFGLVKYALGGGILSGVDVFHDTFTLQVILSYLRLSIFLLVHHIRLSFFMDREKSDIVIEIPP